MLPNLLQTIRRLAISAPTCCTLREIFPQHTENTQILDISKQHEVMPYHRYVDDIPILYVKYADINKTLSYFDDL
jgi:hypothetical protein